MDNDVDNLLPNQKYSNTSGSDNKYFISPAAYIKYKNKTSQRHAVLTFHFAD